MVCSDNCPVTLEWQPAPAIHEEIIGYYVQVDDDPNFGSVDYESDPADWSTATSATVTLALDKIWYWRVMAHDNYNTASVSPWSSVDAFNMLYAPEGSYIYNWTGSLSVKHLYIPPGVSSVTITALGAGGGGLQDEGTYTLGQNGDRASTTVSTSGDVTLDIYVGQGGHKPAYNPWYFPGIWEGVYGAGYPDGTSGEPGEDDGLSPAVDWAYSGGGGGGASAVLLDGSVLVRAKGGDGGKSGDRTGAGCSGGVCDGGSGGVGGGTSSGDTIYPGQGSEGSDGADPTVFTGTNGKVIIWFN